MGEPDEIGEYVNYGRENSLLNFARLRWGVEVCVEGAQ